MTANQSPTTRPAPYLKGPIPLAYITRAAMLRGSCLNVALAIWHQLALAGTEWVELRASTCARFAVSRYSLYRSLDRLVEAGLVRRSNDAGHRTRVSLGPQALRDPAAQPEP